ncbi:MAG: PAS domain S-box protein [Magnetococcales bacterium]|nr:PAS domain S-box protein [Magnetococcales bacterium]
MDKTLILVVDDDPAMRIPMRHFLARRGYQVAEAGDGVQAQEAFQKQIPDLVLMDAHMPVMDGFTATAELKSMPGGEDVPVVMVTALADSASVEKAFKSGAEEYVTKPIHWAVLAQRVGLLIERKRAEMARREGEARFRAITESASDAIISGDEQSRITFWNPGAESLFGYTAEEIVGQPIQRLIPENLRAAHEKAYQHALDTGRTWLSGKAVEIIGVHRDGRTIPIEISLSTWLLGQRRQFSAIVRDITERVQVRERDERAMQSQIALNALLETALEPLSLSQQLRVSLEIVLSVPWLAVQFKGAIFLMDEESGKLKMAAQKNLAPQLLEKCALVALGQCLCGQAAESRKTVFSHNLEDENHTIRFDGMQPHGHYCMPIISRDKLLGVINLYLVENHSRNIEEDAFLTTICHTLAAIIESRRIEEQLQKAHQELWQTRLDIIHRLGMAAEYRDNDTGMHIIRMSQFAAAIGQAAGLSSERCQVLLNATPMHDVGKIGIPDHVLLKPGRLTEGEYNQIKKHPVIGARMLQGLHVEPLETAYLIALTHHERWDGGGYPHGLSGEEIPIEGRICAIADVFDALTSVRPYKSAWSPEAALEEIVRCSGTFFDPTLVEVFKKIFPEIISIQKAHCDSQAAGKRDASAA